MKKISKWLVVLLFCGLIFRIFIISWSLQFRENTDVLRYKDWARIGYLYGLSDTYETRHLTFGTLPNNQPPGSLYILSGAYYLELQAAKVIFKITHTSPANNMWVNGPLLTIFLRLPSVIADLILGALIYFFIKKISTEKDALVGSSLFLFTPPVWYNSAFWGQMDSLNNLMFFASIFLLYRKKYFWAILFSLLSLLVKFSLLPILPMFIYAVFLKKDQGKQIIFTSILCLIVILTITLPVAQSNIFWIFEFAKNNSLGEMQHITNFAFNFWWFVFHPSIVFGNPNFLFTFSQTRLFNSPISLITYLGFTLEAWAFVLFLLFCVPLLKKLYTLKEKIFFPQNLMLTFCLLSIISFLFLPLMHERYLYPLFPFLAVVVGLSGKYLKTFILLSFLNFLNLYIVWHPMKLWFLPYEIISNSNIQWLISFGIVAIGLMFYYNAVKFGFIHEKRK